MYILQVQGRGGGMDGAWTGRGGHGRGDVGGAGAGQGLPQDPSLVGLPHQFNYELSHTVYFKNGRIFENFFC